MYPKNRCFAQWVYNFITSSVLVAGLPLWLASLARKKWRATAAGRLGLAGQDPPGPLPPLPKPVWVHALSVGEVQSAEPLVRALRRRQTHPIVFSASTHSGHATATRLYGGLVDRIIYFPYDILFSVKKVIGQVDPRLVIVVETDIWPNFLFELQKRRTPAALVNARLSSRSLKGYRKAGWLLRPALQAFGTVCVQSREEAERFERLGVPAERIRATGSIKFDQPIVEDPHSLRKSVRSRLRLSEESLVVVAGSTHAGEEEAILRALIQLRPRHPELRLIVAPRHPRRAEAVASAAQRIGVPSALINQVDQLDSPPAVEGTEVLIVNALGLLRTLYAAADVTFVGGSLIPDGGHNPLEPAALAKPVLFGPYMHSCADVADRLEHAGGAQRVHDADELGTVLERLLGDPELRRAMGDRAQSVLRANRGAVQRTLEAIDQMAATSCTGRQKPSLHAVT